VLLVGVQDVQLPRQARPLGAPVAEALHARRRNADRVGVVAVRREGPAAQEDGGALEAGRTRAHRDRVLARSFKTAGVDAA
jgi:hypothetical protein